MIVLCGACLLIICKKKIRNDITLESLEKCKNKMSYLHVKKKRFLLAIYRYKKL